MALDQAQIQFVLSWLRSRVGQFRCPACRGDNFNVSELAAVITLQGSSVVMANTIPGVPLVPLVCTKCAHVAFFSARVMGVGLGDRSPGAETQPAPRP